MSKNLSATPTHISQRVSFLTQEILRHDHLYYGLNSPEIDDFEYDLLLRELFVLEKTHPHLQSPSSPTRNLTQKVLENFPPFQRNIPMLSLSNALNRDEAFGFYQSCSSKDPNFFISPKFDGIAIELVYKNGSLKIAATRGDGFIGEDVTLNIKNIRSIPKNLPQNQSLSIRGELVLPKQEFFLLNQQRSNLGLPLLANSRNAVAGLARLIDFDFLQKIDLRFFPYLVVGDSLSKINLHSDQMSLLKEWGFSFTNFESICQSFQQIEEIYQKIFLKRSSLDFNIDGMVILINSSQIQKDWGVSGKYPRYAIAWKFPPEIKETKILNVVWNVGSRGTLIPVAHIEPVVVSGANVKRVTLHNIDYIQKKDIRVGDSVRIVRSGDVIPRILDVVFEKRLPNLIPISAPNQCPECKNTIFEKIRALRLDLFCPNQNLNAAHPKQSHSPLFFQDFLFPFFKCTHSSCSTNDLPQQIRFKIFKISEKDPKKYFIKPFCTSCKEIGSTQVEIFLSSTSQGSNWSLHYPLACDCTDSPTSKEIRYTNFNSSLLCINKNCLGIQFAKLKIFCGKSGLDIQGLGKSQIKLLLENSLITKPSHLYQLQHKDLQKLRGFAQKKILSTLESIQSSRKQSCKRLLCALNIPGIETVTAEKIAKELSLLLHKPQTPQEFISAITELSQSSQYADKEIGKNLSLFLSDQDFVDECLAIVNQMDLQQAHFWEQSLHSTPISGKVVVFTGTFSIPRHIARERAAKLGATVVSAISNSTSLLIVGHKTGGAKIKKALECNIPTMPQEEFLHLIQQFL